MTARTETESLMLRLERRGITLSFAQANTLRRAQLTLRRWYELECGDASHCRSGERCSRSRRRRLQGSGFALLSSD
jgi:hypothetical protein